MTGQELIERVPLLVAQDVDVLVDESRTSLAAASYGATAWPDFRRSLTNTRSHRNLPAIIAIFRRNYPIQELWPVGVFSYVGRTLVLWAVHRGWAKLTRRLR